MTPYAKYNNISSIEFNYNDTKNKNIKKLLTKIGVAESLVTETIYLPPVQNSCSYQPFYESFLEKQLFNCSLRILNKEQLTILRNVVRTPISPKELSELGLNQINIDKDNSIYYLSDNETFLTADAQRLKEILNVTLKIDPNNKFGDIFIGYPVDNYVLNSTLILDKDFQDTPNGDFQTIIETSTSKEFYRYHKYLDMDTKNEQTLNLLVKAIRLGMTEPQLNTIADESIEFCERNQFFNSCIVNNTASYLNNFTDFRYKNPLIDEIYKDTNKLINLVKNPPSLEKLETLNNLIPIFDDNTSQKKKALSYFSTIYKVPEFVDIENYIYIANFQLSKEKLEKLLTFIEKFPDGVYEFQSESITAEQLRVLATPQMSLTCFNAYLQIFLKHKNIDTFNVLKYVKPDKQHPVMIEKIIKTITTQNEDFKPISKSKIDTTEKQSADSTKENVIEETKDIANTNTETDKKEETVSTSHSSARITLDDIDDFDDFKDFKFLY